MAYLTVQIGVSVHCKNNYENEWHIFFGCSKLQELWSATGLVFQGLLNVVHGFIMPFFSPNSGANASNTIVKFCYDIFVYMEP